MDWPARLVVQKRGKAFVKLFEVDSDDLLQVVREDMRMSLEDQIVVRGEGGDDAIVCRKSYLLQISSYFRAFMERWNNDEAASTLEFKLENIPLDVFKNLLELSSTGLLEMRSHSDISTLVGAASFLEMKSLSDRFSTLIRDEMNNNNSSVILWSYMTSEEYHGYVGLDEEALKFVRSKFEYILETCSEQLMDFSGKQWLEIISDPNLFVTTEDTLFRTICRWVAVDILRRSDDFVAMVKYIRGGRLSENILVEFRDEPSTPPLVRMFITCINDSSESRPRTTDVVAFMPFNDNGGMVCFDPFARSVRPVSLSSKFPTSVRRRKRVEYLGSSRDVIFMSRDNSIFTFDPVLDNGALKLADISPYHSHRIEWAAAYFGGFVYLLSCSKYRVYDFLEVDCSNFSSCNVRELPVTPCDLSLRDLALIGFAGKIHIFTVFNRHITYDPRNKTWSAGSLVTPPFEKRPERCCVGPDGMIYIKGSGETRLWIFDASTLECRISADCAEEIREVMNVKDKIVCVFKPKQGSNYATRVYDHIGDLWTEPHETTIRLGEDGKFFPVRLLASSFNLVPRSSRKRPLED